MYHINFKSHIKICLLFSLSLYLYLQLCLLKAVTSFIQLIILIFLSHSLLLPLTLWLFSQVFHLLILLLYVCNVVVVVADVAFGWMENFYPRLLFFQVGNFTGSEVYGSFTISSVFTVRPLAKHLFNRSNNYY